RAAAALPPFDALAVVGFGGALDARLRPGEVLVATEVRYGDLVIPCPSARRLAAELARAGLPARLGPLLTSDHLVHGAQRAREAAGGALAVDMETGPLAAAAGGRPLAAVRVIVDAPGAPLLSPGTPRRAAAARRTLRRLGPPLTRWSAAAGSSIPAVPPAAEPSSAVIPSAAGSCAATGPPAADPGAPEPARTGEARRTVRVPPPKEMRS
ncbi:phosphorylase family protein, partial [Sphaerisporangium melleum]